MDQKMIASWTKEENSLAKMREKLEKNKKNWDIRKLELGTYI